MLVQVREADELIVVSQHDHGVLSGALAWAWDDGGEVLEQLLLVGITMHDHPWCAEDEVPRFNPATGRPHDFVDLPMGPRLALYREGLDALERVHPWIGCLVSLHYTTFSGTRGLEDFQASERARRARLFAKLGGGASEGSLERALRWLKYFDILSLFICLTPEGSDPASWPRWLNAANAGRTPDGRQLSLQWKGRDLVEVAPFPFRRPLELEIPIRRLGAARFASEEAMRSAFAESPRETWALRVTPN